MRENPNYVAVDERSNRAAQASPINPVAWLALIVGAVIVNFVIVAIAGSWLTNS